MFSWTMARLVDVTIQLDGNVYASENWEDWPYIDDTVNYVRMNFWSITDSNNVKIMGKGTIDGRGYLWWAREWRQKNGKGGRPFVLYFTRTSNIEVTGILVKNSPYYNVVLYDCENGYLHDMEIYVDVWGQLELSQLFSSPIE